MIMLKSKKNRIVMLSIIGAIFFSTWFMFSLPSPLFSSPYSTIVEDKSGKLIAAHIAHDYQWRFPASDSIPYKFANALLLFEDEYFYTHIGINPMSLWKALRNNIKYKKIINGGSTITMQVIRLSRGNKPRTILEKIYEIILALRVELSYSKQEILALYATHAPFGGNTVGLEAASWRYYNRAPQLLSWGEAAALAVLPNSPALVFPGKNEHILLKKRNTLLQKLHSRGIIDKISLELAQLEPLPQKPNPLPQIAPHLLTKIIADGYTGKKIRTTIEESLQKKMLDIAHTYTARYQWNYIHNIAIIVAETQSGNIVSYIGNVSNKESKYVDNCISLRSSGSILKPFLYALMLHDGILLPHTLIPDIPTRIQGYTPQNFDKTFEGVVPASQALSRSLNIPFVRMLQHYGVALFIDKLQQIGFTNITKSAEHYGLSLILGGAETSLWQSVSAYASLGRSLMNYNTYHSYFSQDYRPISYTQRDEPQQYMQSSVIDAGSIYCTLDAMRSLIRPWDEMGWEQFSSSQTIAWKTGTSFGHRDAWAIGVTPTYTIGVWVGNSSGEGRPGLTGLNYAAPILFEAYKQVHTKDWFAMPATNMVEVATCKLSGNKAGELCGTPHTIFVPQKGKHAEPCNYHTLIHVDSTEEYRVTEECYNVYNMKQKTYFVLSPTQEWYYKKNHPHFISLPPFYAGCNSRNQKHLDFINLDNNTSILIPQGLDGEKGKIIVEAVHQQADAELFWHIDNEFVAQTKGKHTIEIAPQVGKHTATIIDEDGNTATRNFTILKSQSR